MGTKSENNKGTLAKKEENHWSAGLLKSMKDPELIVVEDEFCVTIRDTYPKASFHYLVCAKEDIPTLKSVTIQHLKLLKHMHKVGEELSAKHKGHNFLLGYHAVPSMVRLHLHVISDDFDSPCLKTKKHWNSFTTDFFVSSKKVTEELEKNGKITFIPVSKAKALINLPLKCHKCQYIPKHMPDLKYHLKTHLNKKK